MEPQKILYVFPVLQLNHVVQILNVYQKQRSALSWLLIDSTANLHDFIFVVAIHTIKKMLQPCFENTFDHWLQYAPIKMETNLRIILVM